MAKGNDVALDVMLVESTGGVADEAAMALVAAGHRVHRCHEPGTASFPCVGVIDHERCPIDRGVDVALLVRDGAPSPTPREHGVSCALRAGVPVVEDGPSEGDPYSEWIAARVNGGDLTEACETAARDAFDPLIRSIERHTRRLLDSARIEPSQLHWYVESRGHGLDVRLDGPPMTRQLEQALAVRVLDALQDVGRTFGQVDVTFAGGREDHAVAVG